MIDEHAWNFTGTGTEAGPDHIEKPNPGHHFYEFAETLHQRLEDEFGIRGHADTMQLPEYDTFIG